MFVLADILHHEAIDLFCRDRHSVVVAKLTKNVKKASLEFE